MSYKIPVYQPSLNGNEKKYVNECIDSNWISSKGEYVNKFEEKFSEYIGVKHSTTVCNGTVALHLALVTLGIGEGDEVIVPSFTYIASVSSISHSGAKPVFADSLESTWQLDPEDVKRKITDKTKAIMCVHIYGNPCEMDEICKIAKENNIFVIEDCAESFGSKYNNKYTGTFGDISTFSFYGNKTITTGEGGMVVTNDETLYDRAYHFKMHGLAKYREYWHDVIGYNYRMTNICAAIGLAQLEKADEKIKMKRDLFVKYKDKLKDLPLEFQNENLNVLNTYWMITILTSNINERDGLREHLKNASIETRPSFYPVHTMPMYATKYQRLPVAEKLGWCGINLPSYPELKDEEIDFISNSIREFYNK
ncbi:MAG TPA: perosamine synthetase [Bacteroidetes bacterium]|nr:DegT/DnrJ/EryC1/StrS family aminotransferase [Ignavibacteria bacterium]HCA41822.1 perosamine synthetase [Bacteroidota bacterium]HCN37105.1 perosamine synthetase [Bacteroidota bacterium]